MEETPEQQEANRKLRKGMKRPEHGPWPVADLKEKKKEMAKKMHVKHEGRDMYFQKTTKRGETRLHAK